MELNGPNVEPVAISAEERAEEQKLIRRMQMMMNMVMQVIAQDGSLTIDEAAQMIADTRKAALAMFPGNIASAAFLLSAIICDASSIVSDASCAITCITMFIIICSRRISFCSSARSSALIPTTPSTDAFNSID